MYSILPLMRRKPPPTTTYLPKTEMYYGLASHLHSGDVVLLSRVLHKISV